MNRVELEDRILWFDGDITVTPEQVAQYFNLSIKNVFVNEITQEIVKYNSLVSPDEQLCVKETISPFDYGWNLPSEYLKLDVRKYVFDKAKDILIDYNNADVEERVRRIHFELNLYEKLNLFPILQTVIYIINKFETNNIVWGVGRGSSVSSYVLYIIGVHDVDSVEYKLDVHDFLRE